MGKKFSLRADVLVSRTYEVGASSLEHARQIVEKGEVEHLTEEDSTSPMVTDIKEKK